MKRVYVISERKYHQDEPYYWKIGIGASAEKRCREHQMSNPRELRVEAISCAMPMGRARIIERILLDGSVYPDVGEVGEQPNNPTGEWMKSYRIEHMEWAVSVVQDAADPWA